MICYKYIFKAFLALYKKANKQKNLEIVKDKEDMLHFTKAVSNQGRALKMPACYICHIALYYINPYHCYVLFLLDVEVLAVICHCGMSRKEGLLLKCLLESKQQPAEQDLFISLLVR